MPTTIELPPDVEAEMRDEAVRRTVRVNTLRGRPRAAKVTATPDILTPDERKILDDLNAELPRAFWLQYNALQNKIQDGVASASDLAQLEAMLDTMSEWNVRRIHAFITMAEPRGIGWSELMRRLKITHHPDATVGQ